MTGILWISVYSLWIIANQRDGGSARRLLNINSEHCGLLKLLYWYSLWSSHQKVPSHQKVHLVMCLSVPVRPYSVIWCQRPYPRNEFTASKYFHLILFISFYCKPVLRFVLIFQWIWALNLYNLILKRSWFQSPTVFFFTIFGRIFSPVRWSLSPLCLSISNVISAVFLHSNTPWRADTSTR